MIGSGPTLGKDKTGKELSAAHPSIISDRIRTPSPLATGLFPLGVISLDWPEPWYIPRHFYFHPAEPGWPSLGQVIKYRS